MMLLSQNCQKYVLCMVITTCWVKRWRIFYAKGRPLFTLSIRSCPTLGKDNQFSSATYKWITLYIKIFFFMSKLKRSNTFCWLVLRHILQKTHKDFWTLPPILGDFGLLQQLLLSIKKKSVFIYIKKIWNIN